MKTVIKLKVGDVEVDDSMVVNRDDFIPRGESNPHNVRPFVIGGEFGALAIVFADCLQYALDEAADEGKLEVYKVHPDDDNDESVSYLGNFSLPYDLTYIWAEELPHVDFSFVTLLAAHKEQS